MKIKLFTCESSTALGLERWGSVSHEGWDVGFDDIVDGLDTVRACDIGRQGSRGIESKLCDVGKAQRADSILNISKSLRNAIGITTEKQLSACC